MLIRQNLKRRDIREIERITRESGFFTEEEISIARELAVVSFRKGAVKSGYHFVICESESRIVGFSCYGKVPCTKDSYDLYWIVVHKDYKNLGFGKKLLKKTGEEITLLGGKKVYAETSSTPLYTPTREFYLNNSFVPVSEIEDFYDNGDNRIIYQLSL